jgi:hypothetical protein
MLMVMGPHQAFGNIPRSIEFTVEWVRDLIAHLTRNGLTYVEARRQAVEEWMAHAHAKAEGLLSSEIDSWMTGVNMNVDGRQQRRLVRYSGTAPEYRARCTGMAAGGYAELVMR